MGTFSYASTILSGIGFGFVAQQWGWNAAYATILFAALVGVVVLMLMWPLGVRRGANTRPKIHFDTGRARVVRCGIIGDNGINNLNEKVLLYES